MKKNSQQKFIAAIIVHNGVFQQYPDKVTIEGRAQGSPLHRQSRLCLFNFFHHEFFLDPAIKSQDDGSETDDPAVIF